MSDTFLIFFIETSHVHVFRIIARLKGEQMEGRGRV